MENKENRQRGKYVPIMLQCRTETSWKIGRDVKKIKIMRSDPRDCRLERIHRDKGSKTAGKPEGIRRAERTKEIELTYDNRGTTGTLR